MTNVYPDTQYSIKKPKCQGENLKGYNLSGKKDKIYYVTQGSWNVLFFCLLFIFFCHFCLMFMCSSQLHSPGKKEGEAISTNNGANKTLLLPNERDFFPFN